MFEDIKRRLDDITLRLPREVVLHLDDGREYRHGGPVAQFVAEGMDEIRAGHGPIVEALRRTVDAEGCGLIWQVLQAITSEDSSDVPLEPHNPSGFGSIGAKKGAFLRGA